MTFTEQIENLKQELREFIALSKTITGGECKIKPYEYAVFVMRSRNISPAMAECLLVAVTMIEAMSIEVNVECSDEALNAYAQDSKLAQDTLQKILNIWEASK
jgi:hypothetical protein